MRVEKTEITRFLLFRLVIWGQLGILGVMTGHDSLNLARKDGGVSLEGYFWGWA